MTLYGSFLLKSFRKHTAYRSEIWLRIVLGLIWVGIQVAIWNALIGSGEVDGVTVGNMITYAILNTVLSLTLIDQSLRDVDQKIRSGDIAVDLIKPFNYLLTVFADQLGRSLFIATFTVVPTVAIAALLFGFEAPPSIWNALAFLVSIALALAISFAFACMIIMFAFYFLATFHFVWTFGALKSLFAGSLVPFWFYPEGLRSVAEFLPFQFLGFFPAATWMGQLSGAEILRDLGLGLLWSAVLLGFCSWLWGRITRRLIVQGG
jgi:ABC-2 type transport system permease protein